MSALTDLIYGGSNAVAGLTEGAVNDAIAKLRETLKGTDTEAIKADTEALQKAFYPIAEKIYQAQAQANGQGAEGANGGHEGADGNYYDANFEDKSNQ